MADTKISELPVATIIASPDISPVVRNGVTMQADVSLFGGASSSFLSSNIARIDISGNDVTGTIGDLSKPFLTVQGAIDAIQSGPSLDYPVIDIGNSTFTEDVATTLLQLVFKGSNGASDFDINSPFNSLTYSPGTGSPSFVFINCNVPTVLSATAGTLQIIGSASRFGDFHNTVGAMTVDGSGTSGQGFFVAKTSLAVLNCRFPTINSPDAIVVVDNTFIDTVTAALSLTLVEGSRVMLTNNASSTIYGNQGVSWSLEKGVLPDSDPHIDGAGYWLAGVLTRSNG